MPHRNKRRRTRRATRGASLASRSLRCEGLEDRRLLSISPTGPETQLNTYLLSDNTINPKVAMDTAGNYVAVWQSNGEDGSGLGIYAMRFNSAGQPLLANPSAIPAPAGNPYEFRVNTYTVGDQKGPSIAMDSDGDFVITWTSDYQLPNDSIIGVYAQRFNAAGAPQGSEFLVNSNLTANSIAPTVAMDSSGNFVIGWTTKTNYQVFARRYNAAGTALANQFQVSQGNQFTGPFGFVGSQVAMSSSGAFVISYAGFFSQSPTSTETYARRYNSLGQVQGNQFQVNTYENSAQWASALAMDSVGNFTVVWSSLNQDGSGYGIYGQRYTSAGNTLDSEFRINTTTANHQRLGTIAMDGSGNFTVIWESLNQDGSGWGIYGQRYNASAVAQGTEFRVNTTTSGDQQFSQIALNANGDSVVTWAITVPDPTPEVPTNVRGLGVYAQRYHTNVAPIANAGGPYNITSGSPLTLNASGSSDPEGQPLTYSWTINGNAGAATGVSPNLNWSQLLANGISAAGGTYTINVQVSDPYSGVTTTTDLNNLIVNPLTQQPPIANAGGSYSILEGQSLTLDASASSDPNLDPLTYAWDLDNNGSFDDAFGVNPTVPWATLVSHGISDGTVGYNQIRVRVDDGQGGVTTSSTVSVTVNNVAPTADAAGPYTILEGQSLTLNGGGSDPAGAADPLTYGWDLNNDGNFTDAIGANPTVPWSTLVSFGINDGIGATLFDAVRLRVTDGDGGLTISTADLTVNNAAPTSNAGGPYTVIEGQSFTLDGSLSSDPAGAADPLNYAWDLDFNGTIDVTGVAPTLTWAYLVSLGLNDDPAALNQVRLQVDDGEGGVTISPLTSITVINAPPTADAGGPYTIAEGDSLILSGSGSDPAGAADPLTYSWDINGDTVFGDAFGAAPTVPWATLVALNIDGNGTLYDVKVRVSDGDGGVTDSSAVTLTVANAAPTADAGGPYTIVEGQSLNLNGSGSDPAGAADPLTYSWDLDGDNDFDDASGANPTVAWATLVSMGYADGPATFSQVIRVRVDDGDGGVTESTAVDLNVNNAPPTADAGGPYTFAEGDSLVLNGLGSDPAGAADSLTYSWDINDDDIFGDVVGASPLLTWNDLVGFGISDGTGATYNLKLQVSDEDGGVTESSALLTVNNALPTADAGGPYSITEGQSLTLSGSGSDPAGAADPLTYSWDINGDTVFGDAFGAAPIVPWATLVALDIDGNGTPYNVTVRVDDGDGGVTESSAVTLTVANAAPTADAGGPYTVIEGQALTLDASLSSDPAGAADPLTYSWDLDGDNDFDDASGANPTVAWATLVSMGYADGPAMFSNTIRVRVDDGDGGVTTSTAVDLNVNNAPPTAGISGPASVARGASANYTLTATDPATADQAAGFTWSIDWNGDGSDIQVVNGLSGLVVAHTFSTVGARTIKVTATDNDGGVSSQSTHAVSVSAVQLVNNGGLFDLVWTGTAGEDRVSFEDLGGGDIRVTTTLDNNQATAFVETISGVTGIVKASGLAGNDTLDGTLLSTTSTRLDGGTGNNTLYGGGANDTLIGGASYGAVADGPEGQQGNNVVVGGAGDDTIYGNAINGAEGKGGNNILLGGAGNDTIYGNWTDGGEGGGYNIIVGGADADTLYDYKIADGAEGKGSILVAGDTTLNVAQLQLVMAEWTSTHTYTDRVANILGPGALSRLNGSSYLQPSTTTTNDAAADVLWGSTGGTAFNWFLSSVTLATDTINRAKAGETQTPV